jgi:hypothetical protein
MRIQLQFAVFVAIALACSLHADPARAASRAWVSGAGVDQAGCGGLTSPCRTPQYAHDNIVAAGGEIDFLNPAGYGAITITKAISLVNDGVGTTGMLAPAGANAITINAGSSDAIQLRGLTIEGAGVGYNGIVFNSGGSLAVSNCVAQNFVNNGSLATGNGILIQPTSGNINFVITNTTSSNNFNVGISYFPSSGLPSATGVIDHVVTTANNYGILVDTVALSGGSTAITISNSVASNNGQSGILANNSAPLILSIDNVSASGNFAGVTAGNTVRALLGRSVITGNGTGVQNNTTGNTLFSYKDNRISGNTTTDISSPLNTAVALQ